MAKTLTFDTIQTAMRLLAQKLDLMQAEPVQIVVCGGSALIAMGLRQRGTRDVDIVALMSPQQTLISPAPLPDLLLQAAAQVARDMGLAEHWLNNGPSQGEGGLFQMGLPDGFVSRLTRREYGPRLTVHFIGRIDQIHFKLYAATDQQVGVQMEDLIALKPTVEEIETAARWTMTHDVSEPFKMVLKEILKQLGHESVAQRI
ncbi:MAG: hypothetical protein HY360_03370 [Verrucomicrobia bacterium]|nr:hypothetical protein [Verrucomicrobiota bacterium]